MACCLTCKPSGAVSLALLLAGCASWLPESHNDTTPFKSYEEARSAFMSLEPMKSDQSMLAHSGFNPAKHPNTTLLTHADVARRFLPSSLLKREDLEPGIVYCLEARDACRGMEVVGAKIDKMREGSFWADFFNFQRHTSTKGWRFTAIVLMVNDLIVYRSWAGQPDINELEVTRNPLGPLQDIGPSTATSTVLQR